MSQSAPERTGEPLTGEALERRLDELMDQEWFEPLESFVSEALVKDKSIYERAERDPNEFWAEQARELHWDGYFWIIGRIDDVVNVSGHRLSTAEVESAIVAHSKVAEAAGIGQSDEDSGQAICAFVILEGDLKGDSDLEQDIREPLAQRIGKLARPKRILWSDDLPKTRSGKIMRRLLRDIAEGRALGDVTTLRDPEVMKELEKKVTAEEAKED